MHYLIERLFKKKGIEDVAKLTPDDQAAYEEWKRILSAQPLTVEAVTEFCRYQLSLIETTWKNLDNSTQKNERLIAQHTVYKTLLEVIEAPQKQKEQLEAHLHKLLTME